MYGKMQKTKVKRQRKSGKVFAQHMTEKKVIYLIYKELLCIHKKTKLLNRKLSKKHKHLQMSVSSKDVKTLFSQSQVTPCR